MHVRVSACAFVFASMHWALSGCSQELLAGTSTAVIQHLAAQETISHTHSLCTEMLHLSNLKTFTMLPKCTL